MKFTLKEYQDEAVQKVLAKMDQARRMWHDYGDQVAFSLTAATGAGKTVMAAAVFEALFYGIDEFDFDPDPTATVIWFSDDPSLNEQSRFRLMEASDKLTTSDLVTIENTFSQERFEPGKIYFLNTQKLSKTGILVRGHESYGASQETLDGRRLMPDLRSHTIWDTIQNTVEDPDTTLYLVLDEAHRGMKSKGSGTMSPTIVKQLINGHKGVPGIPIVWGISATVERFNQAVNDMSNRAALTSITVDSTQVQESGLLKDTINLDIPTATGDAATVLLRRGAKKLREISDAWAKYGEEQDEADAVKPLMVLQVPNTPKNEDIGAWLQTIFEEYPDLPTDSICNVFGEHRIEQFGPYQAPYTSPERIQERDDIRIIVAKDAISTGWDCPRAEVMVSFRPAKDKTHITQLLGRMVRAPLARRIPGNERLNSVDCLLPYFDRRSVEKVVDELMHGIEPGEDVPRRRILINAIDVLPNAEIDDDVWEKFLSLPCQSLPRKEARPIRRLTVLAHELAADGIVPDAGKIAHKRLHKRMEKLKAQFAKEIEEASGEVMVVQGQQVTAQVGTGELSFNDFVEQADEAVINDVFSRACRLFSADVSRTYSEFLAADAAEDDEYEDALLDAHVTIGAMGLVPDIKAELDQEAEQAANEWLIEHAETIRGLNDARRDVYRQLREMSREPLNVDLQKPREWRQETMARNTDGTEEKLPVLRNHLMSDADGGFPVEWDSGWEDQVVAAEMDRDDFVAWYRNPKNPCDESLGISYERGGEPRILRPDFIFFGRTGGGEVVADIVDPHGTHLGDALPKLKGLAAYASQHGPYYRRIEAVAAAKGKLRRLNMLDAAVREVVLAADDAEALFAMDLTEDYP